ncbi:hypothetical protein [Streptomyces sp. NPDC002851]
MTRRAFGPQPSDEQRRQMAEHRRRLEQATAKRLEAEAELRRSRQALEEAQRERRRADVRDALRLALLLAVPLAGVVLVVWLSAVVDLEPDGVRGGDPYRSCRAHDTC